MRTIDKGTVAELSCAARFSELGYVVLFPSQTCRYDFAIEKNGEFQRVQVKTATLKRNGVATADLRTRGPYRAEEPYSAEQVDLFAFWCPETREVYTLPISEARRRSVSFRLKPAKNSQRRGIRTAESSRL